MAHKPPTQQYNYWRFLLVASLVFSAINLVPLALGHPVIVYDNLTQNNPLRFLASEIIRSGHLPLWNPLAWSGTPLLAGFNAGVFFPLFVLYLIFPPLLAFSLFLAGLEIVLAFGMFWLFCHLKVAQRPASLIALASPLLGFFASQSVHLDMASGLALVPYLVIAVIRLARATSVTQGIYAGLVMGISYSLVVLGGAPEAMIYEALFIAIFTILQLWRSRPRLKVVVAGACVFLVTVVLVPAAQLLPGLGFVSGSQRGSLPSNFATLGPLYPSAFFSLVTPFIFGGTGGFGSQPPYFGPYGFEELTIFAGIVPLALAIYALASLVATRRRPSADITRSSRGILVDLALATLVSTIASLGSYTPLEAVLLHIPVYNQQRLPSRNIFALDFLIMVYAGFGLEHFLVQAKPAKTLMRIVGMIFAAIVTSSALIVTLNSNFTYWLGGTSSPIAHLGEITISNGIEAMILVAFAALVYLRPRLSTNAVAAGIGVLLAIDATSFGAQAYFSVAPTSAYATDATAPGTQFASIMRQVGGRFAIYDPNLLYHPQELAIGQPNLAMFNRLSSIQGYSSLTLGQYDALTSTHVQDTMDPTLFTSELGRQLELTTVATGMGYFSNYVSKTTLATAIPANLIPAPTGAVAPNFDLKAQVSDFVGESVTSDQILVDFSIANPSGTAVVPGDVISSSSISALGVRQGNSGPITWAKLEPSKTTSVEANTVYSYQLPTAVTFDQVVGQQQLPGSISDPSSAIVAGITVVTGKSFLSLNGMLTGYLTPAQYRQIATIDQLLILERRNPDPLWAKFAKMTPEPPLPISPTTKVQLRSASFGLDGIAQYQLYSGRRSTFTVSETFAPGWEATVTQGSKTSIIPARSCGIFVCVSIPSGPSVVKLNYQTPHVKAGLVASSLGVLWILGVAGWLWRRKGA